MAISCAANILATPLCEQIECFYTWPRNSVKLSCRLNTLNRHIFGLPLAQELRIALDDKLLNLPVQSDDYIYLFAVMFSYAESLGYRCYAEKVWCFSAERNCKFASIAEKAASYSLAIQSSGGLARPPTPSLQTILTSR